MIAIIYDYKTESTYTSPVFAIKDGAEVIAFNAERTAVRRIKLWHVCIVSQTDGEFDSKNGKWRGYSWVIGDENLLKSLKYGKSASVEAFPEFKKYTDEILLPEWFEVKTADDIAVLENITNLTDGELQYSPRDGSDISVKADTDLGYYVNIRLLGVYEESPAESMDHLSGIGIERYDDGFGFIHSDKHIKCRGILWNVEVITVHYLREHRNYPDISALYEDIRLQTDNAELIDGKLIINGEDKIEAEFKNGEYVITVNGKREKGSVEDQDIYYLLLEYVYSGKLPPPVWKFSHSRFVSLMSGIRASAIPAIFALLSLAVVVTSESRMGLVIGAFSLAIFSFIICIIISISLSVRIAYEINDSVFIMHKLGSSEILPIAAINEVTLKRSRIFKKRGTVKIKTDGKNYYFRFVIGADEAYELILEKIQNNQG